MWMVLNITPFLEKSHGFNLELKPGDIEHCLQNNMEPANEMLKQYL